MIGFILWVLCILLAYVLSVVATTPDARFAVLCFLIVWNASFHYRSQKRGSGIK